MRKKTEFVTQNLTLLACYYWSASASLKARERKWPNTHGKIRDIHHSF